MIQFEVEFLASQDLRPRSSNLYFTSERLRLVQSQLTMLGNTNLNLDPERWYASIEGAFTAYGLDCDVPRIKQVQEQWMNFLPDEMKDHLLDLEQTNKRIASEITTTGIVHSYLSSFRVVYCDAFSRARRVADCCSLG
jgi:hypothetical protein